MTRAQKSDLRLWKLLGEPDPSQDKPYLYCLVAYPVEMSDFRCRTDKTELAEPAVQQVAQ